MRLVLALITSRLDYCNATLAGLPKSTLDLLQRVQNAVARLIFQLGPIKRPCDAKSNSAPLAAGPLKSAIQAVPAHALYTLWSCPSLYDE